MSDDAFQPGSVVKLKSGGPLMTVSEYDAISGVVKVNYFRDQGPMLLIFKSFQLEIVRAKEVSDVSRERWYRTLGEQLKFPMETLSYDDSGYPRFDMRMEGGSLKSVSFNHRFAQLFVERDVDHIKVDYFPDARNKK